MKTAHAHPPCTILTFAGLVLLWWAGPSIATQIGEERLAPIERLTGAKGELVTREGVVKVSVPRSDLSVRVGGVKLTPPMGLTSWAAFVKAGQQTMVMGDMVMLEDQVNPVMDVALESGLEVTALHSHFLWDSPKVMFMHISGMGAEEKLAAAVGTIFDRIKETSGGKGVTPHEDLDPAGPLLDETKIEEILGRKGKMANGVYKVTIRHSTRVKGYEIGEVMGVNTWAAFAGSDDRAVVDGDVVAGEHTLQPLLAALRAAGINVVAIHNHMIGESPRMIFVHYWGIGSTRDLARGVKSAFQAIVK